MLMRHRALPLLPPGTGLVVLSGLFALNGYVREERERRRLRRTFERYVSPLGVVAYARCAPLGTTMCYFEPLCAAEDLPALVDEWLLTMQGEHVGFWKASRPLAEVLASHPRGFQLAAYGTEHEVDAPPSLAGSAMRGLRRQVDKARNAGVVVTPIAADTGPCDPVWREI